MQDMTDSGIPTEFEELKSSGALPSPTGVGMKILELTRTEDYSVDDMAAAIMSDPSLTGRILQLANSASVAGTEAVTTVSGAIMRLGSGTVRTLALAFSLVSDREAGACRPFDYERYWSLSLARAVSAQILSDATGVGKPEEAYICGLLAEVGILALASVHSTRYGQILLETQGQSLGALRKAEFEAFEIDHATVAECMLKDWGLPKHFSEGIAGFCRRRAFDPENAQVESLADLLRFSDAIGSAFMLGETTPPRRIVEIGDQLELMRDALEMDDKRMQMFCENAAKQWRSWGESLEIETDDVSFANILSAIAEGRELEKSEEQGLTAESGAPPETSGETTSTSDLATEPRRKTVRRPTAAMRTSDAASDVDRISVLAVDDDPVSLRLLVRHMRNQRFDVTMARGGQEGLRKALQEKPDILVIDQDMPGLSGLEVVESLRRSSVGSSMYILLVTGHDSDDLLIEAFDAGVDDFLPKPIRPRLLSARIKAGVRIANMQRKIERDRKTILDQLADRNTLNRKLRTVSLTDPLTGLPNRRHAMNRVEAEWKSTERNGVPFSVIMMDIDKFKVVNDTYGHDVGDDVLQATAQAVKGALRGEDEVCRLGGEEFLVICRGAPEKDGVIAAERIRQAVEANIVQTPGFNKAITISLGVAGTHAGVKTLMELLKASDEAVYQAKNGGRNQVRAAGAPDLTPEEDEKSRRTA